MIDQLLMDMLNNKEQILEQILKDIIQADTIIHGFKNVAERIETSSEADLRRQFKTMIKVITKQHETMQRLLIIALIQIQDDRFDASLGHALNKMGRGQEALQAMFKKKMGG